MNQQKPLCEGTWVFITLHWRHNERDGVANHQHLHCLLNHLFGRRSKKTSKLRFTGLCADNTPVTGEFPAQKTSNAENVSIWWRHHNEILHFWVNIYGDFATISSPILDGGNSFMFAHGSLCHYCHLVGINKVTFRFYLKLANQVDHLPWSNIR